MINAHSVSSRAYHGQMFKHLYKKNYTGNRNSTNNAGDITEKQKTISCSVYWQKGLCCICFFLLVYILHIYPSAHLCPSTLQYKRLEGDLVVSCDACPDAIYFQLRKLYNKEIAQWYTNTKGSNPTHSLLGGWNTLGNCIYYPPPFEKQIVPTEKMFPYTKNSKEWVATTKEDDLTANSMGTAFSLSSSSKGHLCLFLSRVEQK